MVGWLDWLFFHSPEHKGKISLPVVLFPHLLLSTLSLSLSYLLGGDNADLWPGMKKDPPDGTRAGRCLTAPQEKEEKKAD